MVVDKTKDGMFKVREAYEWLRNEESGEQIEEKKEIGYKLICNKLTPRKVIVHAWRVLRRRLPTKKKLMKKGIIGPNEDSKCALCNEHPETVKHALFECSSSYAVWMASLKWWGVRSVLSSNPLRNLLHFSRVLKGRRGEMIAVCLWECIVWMSWKGRNAKIFQQKEFSTNKLIEELKARSWSWLVGKEKRLKEFAFHDWSENPKLILEHNI